MSYPLPGTPFYERVKAQLGAKQNWLDSDDLAMMYRATYAPEFYRALHALVHAEFRVRKSLDAIARAAARPCRFAAVTPTRWRSLAWHALRLPMLQRRLARLSEPTAQTLPLLDAAVESAGRRGSHAISRR